MRPPLPMLAAGTALVATVLGHAALGHGTVLPLACASVQAIGVGILAAAAPPVRPWHGVAVSTSLLAGIALGARHGPATALLAATGLGHAMLYTALLTMTVRSLAAGREALVTRIARRANPHFHDGMIPYTRKVTLAWCMLFAAQLAASALLLATRPALWAAFVSGWHLAALPVLMLGELLIRRIRFRNDRRSGLRAMIGAIRAMRRPPRRHRPFS